LEYIGGEAGSVEEVVALSAGTNAINTSQRIGKQAGLDPIPVPVFQEG